MRRPLSIVFHLPLVLLIVAASGSPGRAAIIWSEGVNGDLSNTQGAPTVLNLGFGTNSIVGSVTGAGDPRDWVTIRVPQGALLTNIVLRSYTGADPQGFFGFQKGPVFVGTDFNSNPMRYAGWTHFGTAAVNGLPPQFLPPVNLVGADLLPFMADPRQGAQGFTFPLPPGDYAFIIQQTGGSTVPISYQFDFVTTPEPASVGVLGVLCAVGLFRQARRTRSASA